MKFMRRLPCLPCFFFAISASQPFSIPLKPACFFRCLRLWKSFFLRTLLLQSCGPPMINLSVMAGVSWNALTRKISNPRTSHLSQLSCCTNHSVVFDHWCFKKKSQLEESCYPSSHNHGSVENSSFGDWKNTSSRTPFSTEP